MRCGTLVVYGSLPVIANSYYILLSFPPPKYHYQRLHRHVLPHSYNPDLILHPPLLHYRRALPQGCSGSQSLSSLFLLLSLLLLTKASFSFVVSQ